MLSTFLLVLSVLGVEVSLLVVQGGDWENVLGGYTTCRIVLTAIQNSSQVGWYGSLNSTGRSLWLEWGSSDKAQEIGLLPDVKTPLLSRLRGWDWSEEMTSKRLEWGNDLKVKELYYNTGVLIYYYTCVYHEAGMRCFTLSQSSPIGPFLPRSDDWSFGYPEIQYVLLSIYKIWKNWEKS